MVKIFARTQSSKIGLTRIYYQPKLIFTEISKEKAGNELMFYILHSTNYLFLECCNPRFSIQKLKL